MPADTQGSLLTAPFYPIIYVRGFAGTENEIEDTVADPYMGFNIGATKFRQAWTGAIRRHYFESPLYRLTKDFGYSDVYTDGVYMPPGMPIKDRSVIIYRYYDEQFFNDLDDDGDKAPSRSINGKVRQIEDFAAGLGKLILRVRQRICNGDKQLEEKFKVHLVGHSMGGLIIRSFLQNIGHGGDKVKKLFGAAWEKQFKEAKGLVDKVFTYATPHNGIEFSVVGNVPSFFSANDVNNFNRDRMREYLALPSWTQEAVNNLLDRFDPQRFFCLVGTNDQDYAVLYGWSRRLVGPASDGLVRIKNATVHSQKTKNGVKQEAPRAFIHRAHSGHFGIVNSEEGYQNLVRFLFGDVRVDGVLEVDEITLPPEVKAEKDKGKAIRASYHFDVVVRTRGTDFDLHRRTYGEGSAVFRQFDEMFPPDTSKPRNPHLFSVFLSSRARVNTSDPSLGFAIDLAIRVPEYQVDQKLWFDKHYNGDTILRTTIIVEAIPPQEGGQWEVKYGVDPARIGNATEQAKLAKKDGAVEFRIPLDSKTIPGFKGALKIRAKAWK